MFLRMDLSVNLVLHCVSTWLSGIHSAAATKTIRERTVVKYMATRSNCVGSNEIV